VPQFNPEEERVAIATFPTKPAGLPCTAELWLASNMAKVVTSGEIPFTATGGDKSISLPITLPGVEGTYPVRLDVFSNGQRIARFLGDEDVVIVSPVVPVFTFGPVSGRYYRCPLGGSTWNTLDFHCRISNNGAVAATHKISWWWTYPGTYNHEMVISDAIGTVPFSLTLQPGEYYDFRWVGPEHGPADGCNPILAPRRSFSFWLQDELGNRSGVL